MDANIYKLIHIVGALMVFLAFGGLIGRSLLGVEGARLKKLGGISSGLGLILILIGGFGMLAKLGYGFPGWAIAKFVIWIAFGGLIAAINRKPALAIPLWWGVLVLGFIAAYLALWKPF